MSYDDGSLLLGLYTYYAFALTTRVGNFYFEKLFKLEYFWEERLQL